MPAHNKKGGKKYKKNKKMQYNTSKLILKNEEDGVEDQEYGKIIKVNGSGRFRVECFDGKERLGICAGKIKRKVRINLNDIILFCKWDFQDEKCSIIHKYEDHEVSKLISLKEISEQISDSNEFNEFNDSIIFDSSLPEEEDNSEEEKSKDSDGEEDFLVDVNEYDIKNQSTQDKFVYRTNMGVTEIDFEDI